jgi:hypothetical protein
MINNKKINAVFLIGLPDSKELTVFGYNPDGKLLYSWNGNNDFHAQVTNKNISYQKLTLIWFENNKYKTLAPDIIVNCINDADICSQSLKKAESLINSIKVKFPKIKVFNSPQFVSQTTRDAIYKNYKDLSGIYIPKTVRVKPQSPLKLIEEVEKNGMNFPFLIRVCGAHQSESLQLIKSESDIDKLEKYAYGEKEYYVTEFLDYKNEKGLYQKARLVIMNGKILPRHYMTGEDWMVHGSLHEEYMATRDSCKKDEINFLHNYRKMISGDALESLKTIYKKSGLDYLGFDFAIMPDKSLLIFEINPAQNVFIKLDEKNFPYMKKVSSEMVEMLNKTIYDKARSS